MGGALGGAATAGEEAWEVESGRSVADGAGGDEALCAGEKGCSRSDGLQAL